MERLLLTALVGGLPLAFGQDQDATALEEQYKTCSKHYIPAEICTPDIFRQIQGGGTCTAGQQDGGGLSAVRYLQARLKNPESMQARSAHVTRKGHICLSIGAQNGFGGMTVGWDASQVAWLGTCEPVFHNRMVAGVGGLRATPAGHQDCVHSHPDADGRHG